ncbi:MAG TPA: TIGR00269 family protein [archaeon]|nr:TIGR00269 family protein [archaeon]
MAELKIKAMEKCDLCEKEAKIRIPYGPHRFCVEHFNTFFENRVRKNIRTNKLIKYNERVAVGVSGGKDSMVTLYLLHKIFGNRIKLEAILIDEGIKGYRDRSMQIGIDYCEQNQIPFHTVSFKSEFGIEMTDVMKKIHEDEKLGSTCSFCGVFRRHFLNMKAKAINADKLATGHNLDDEVQSIAMSLFRNDFARLARLGEDAGWRKYEEFVPRIKPLYDTPEKEIIAYAAFNGIEHYSEECCPYSWMAMRNQYRKMLNELEDSIPGSKYSILASFRNLKPLLQQHQKENASETMHCKKCGNLANAEICSVCSQLERITNVSKIVQTESKSLKKKNSLTCVETKGM